MRRHLAVLAVLSAAALPACTDQSHVQRNATVHVTGRVIAVDGRALANRPVKLGSGVPEGDAALGVFTFGLACTSGICAGTVKSTTTDAAGAYDVTLKGSETQSTFGEAKSELLTVSAAPTGAQISGAATSARFRIQTTAVKLPDLRLVDPQTTLVSTGRDAVVGWIVTSPPADSVTFADRDGRSVWQTAAGTAKTAVVDGRVLEDTSGRVTVSGGRTDRIEGSDLTQRWTGPGIAYAASAGAPASRGAACTYSHGATSVPLVSGACALTDGDLTDAVPLPPTCAAGSVGSAPPPCPVADAVAVDLAAAVPAQLVVVRGCTAACAVSTSADGRTFAPAGAVTGPFGQVTLSGKAIRAVRVAHPDELREISVWGPAKTTALQTVTHQDEQQLRAPFVARHGVKHRGALIAAAAVLLALVLLGLGFTFGRRRRVG